MAKWIAAEKAKAGLRPAAVTVCSMPERDGKDRPLRIAQSKRACVLVRSSLLTSHKWRKVVSSGRLVYRCHDAFSGVTFVLFCFASFSSL